MEQSNFGYDVNELKFWIQPKRQAWLCHPIDVHHVAMVARRYDEMGVPREQILHNPYVEGSPNTFDTWTAERADNDVSVTLAAMQSGWVRGGHSVDYERYLRGKLVHLGGLYLQGIALDDLRSTAKLVMKKYPEMEYLVLDHCDRTGEQLAFIRLDFDQIDRFMRRGVLPRQTRPDEFRLLRDYAVPNRLA